MIKFTSNTDFDFGIESVSIITDDKQLTKRASARELLKFERTPNQTDLHIIAVGAYEGTGYNRNGDCFLEKDCESNHHYFTKAARAVHKHHRNKKDDPKYGTIKASAYNKPMKRIELIIGLDNDKCQDILEEQEKVGYTSWSMGTRQDYDICSWCGHKATSEKNRCEHIPAKLGELNEDGIMCGMINPDPKWFEISYVKRPADRIGFSLKVASSEKIRPLSTSEYLMLYPGFEPPPEELMISKKAADKRNLLFKLSEMEKHVEGVAKSKGKALHLLRAMRKAHKKKIDAKTIDELRKYDPQKVLKILADHGIVFSPEDFNAYFFGNRIPEESVKGMKVYLPGIFTRLCESGSDRIVNEEKFDPGISDILPPVVRRLVQSLMEDHSLFPGPMGRRIIRITVISAKKPEAEDIPVKTADDNSFESELAKVYSMYKLATLNYMNEKGLLNDEVLYHAIVQNLS